MDPSSREYLTQVSAESGLNFMTQLDDDIPTHTVSTNQAHTDIRPHLSTALDPSSGSLHTLSIHTQIPSDGTTIFNLDGIDQILLRHGALCPGDMVDFHGPTGSGKTHLLYAIIISTILPKFWRYSKSKPPIPMYGKARSVAFFDLDQGFSVDRLKDLLCLQIIHRVRKYQASTQPLQQHHHELIPSTNPPINSNENNKNNNISDTPTNTSIASEIDINSSTFLSKIDQLALSCLRNVHIFRPPDTASTIVLLRTLDTYLLQQTTVPPQFPIIEPQLGSQQQQQRRQSQHPSPPFTFLILDSLSSFYWQDRAQTNHTRVLSLLYDAIHRLITEWGLIFISTSWSFSSTSSTSSSAAFSSTNPSDRTLTDFFRSKLRYRFLLQPRNINQFQNGNLLWREWLCRQQKQQQKQQQQQRQQQRQQQLKKDRNMETDKQETTAGLQQQQQKEKFNAQGDQFEDRPSLFQGQMIIPELPLDRQQPELFRFSLSMKKGIFSFCPPSPLISLPHP